MAAITPTTTNRVNRAVGMTHSSGLVLLLLLLFVPVETMENIDGKTVVGLLTYKYLQTYSTKYIKRCFQKKNSCSYINDKKTFTDYCYVQLGAYASKRQS